MNGAPRPAVWGGSEGLRVKGRVGDHPRGSATAGLLATCKESACNVHL